jgi:hypothetical protein
METGRVSWPDFCDLYFSNGSRIKKQTVQLKREMRSERNDGKEKCLTQIGRAIIPPTIFISKF